MPEGQILPRARERIRRMKERVIGSKESSTQAQVPVGGGELINRGRKLFEELRPGLLPRAREEVERLGEEEEQGELESGAEEEVEEYPVPSEAGLTSGVTD